MGKKIKADDEYFEPVYILGIGAYQCIGEPSKSKMAQIGFVRRPVARAKRAVVAKMVRRPK